MSVFEKGLITIEACNALFALISVPLIFRWVPRNVIYGYRTRATLSDDALWYEANAYFGRAFLAGSIVSALAGVVLHKWQGIAPDFFLQASVAVLVVPTLLAALATARFVRSLVREQ